MLSQHLIVFVHFFSAIFEDFLGVDVFAEMSKFQRLTKLCSKCSICVPKCIYKDGVYLS
jgi:hypothetical protein